MRDRCLRVFQDAGLSDEIAEQLATLIIMPPSGTFDVSELEDADDIRLCLLAAIVAATQHWEYGEALARLLRLAREAIGQMSKYDQGRFWHLSGFAAWRLEGSIYKALQLLRRSVQLVQESDSPDAGSYLPRSA